MPRTKHKVANTSAGMLCMACCTSLLELLLLPPTTADDCSREGNVAGDTTKPARRTQRKKTASRLNVAGTLYDCTIRASYRPPSTAVGLCARTDLRSAAASAVGGRAGSKSSSVECPAIVLQCR
jgi:hypothetical protein